MEKLEIKNLNYESIKILGEEYKNDFDKLAIHPMQSFAWGEAREKTGVKVFRIGYFENEKLISVYQMTVHKVPHTKYFIGYVPRSGIPNIEVVSFIEKWARAEKIIFVKWEPYIRALEAEEQIAALASMRRSKHLLFTEWNQELDLLKSEEELLADCHSKTRYSIRLAERKGVHVREMSTDEGFKIFSDLYFQTCARQRYHGHTRKYQEIVWDTLSKAGIARIFVAWYQGRPLASYELFFWHNRVYYPYGGSADTDRTIPAAQLLMWTAIKTAKSSGAEVFDMWGSLSPDYAQKKHSWNGFTFFKQGFGTKFVHMTPSYDLVVMPFFYNVFSSVYSLRKFFFRKGIL